MTSYDIPAQGKPERMILFQHMKPKHKAGKRRKCFFNLQVLSDKNYTSIKSRKHILTNHKDGNSEGFLSSANTDRKGYELNQCNEAHYIQAQGRQELIFPPNGNHKKTQ